jgi:hypothetical protein
MGLDNGNRRYRQMEAGEAGGKPQCSWKESTSEAETQANERFRDNHTGPGESNGLESHPIH